MTVKNFQNDKDDAWRLAKNLCDEAGINGEDAKLSSALLAKMHLDPKATSMMDPVPGYEDRLVASLMARASNEINLGGRSALESEAQKESMPVFAWYRMASKLIPATAFSFVFVIGLAVVQYLVKNPSAPKSEKEDLWAKVVENASQGEVSRWMASVSDRGTQTWETTSDLAILSSELSEAQLEHVLKKNQEDGGS